MILLPSACIFYAVHTGGCLLHYSNMENNTVIKNEMLTLCN